jgi:hypothetical protein
MTNKQQKNFIGPALVGFTLFVIVLIEWLNDILRSYTKLSGRNIYIESVKSFVIFAILNRVNP